MDYFKNADKTCDISDYGLYNSVLKTTFTDEGPEPFTIDDVKSWSKVEQDTDDEIIEELITSAREDLEDFTGIGFITRTITAVINNSNGGFMLPYGPVTNDPVGEDADGNVLDLSYKLGQINTLGLMSVTYQGGYSVLPKKFKTAIKEQILFLYENRGESAVGLSPIAESRMAKYRTVV